MSAAPVPELPAEAVAEREAIWARYGVGSMVEAPTVVPPGGARVIARAASCEAAAALGAWSAKWDVGQYGILLPYRTDCSDEGHLNYYHLTAPELVEEQRR